MTSYLQTLDPIARVRYQEKLTLLGLSVSEDPYELWSKEAFVENMSLWPPVEYGHNSVERPGVFIKEELMHWKSITTSRVAMFA